MATDKPPLTIIRSPTSLIELHEIWRWNAEHFGVIRADEYLRFLTETIERLANTYATGRAVSSRPELRHIIIRRKPKGHGHIAVYNFDDKEVHLLHVFHTAQNWQNKLANE